MCCRAVFIAAVQTKDIGCREQKAGSVNVSGRFLDLSCSEIQRAQQEAIIINMCCHDCFIQIGRINCLYHEAIENRCAAQSWKQWVALSITGENLPPSNS